MSLALPITVENHQEAPTFNLTRPQDISEGGPFPVIVWANGGCFRSDLAWLPLFERWAKGGFVVLHFTGMGAEDDIAAMLGQTTKDDHKALIDWVEKANENGPYAGKLDLKRVVVAGNSCGGVTSLQTAAEDERAAAVFVLSGSSAIGSTDTQVMSKIKVPVGFVEGGEEDISRGAAEGDYEAMNAGVPAMLMYRKEGDHLTVSTDTMVLAEDAEIGLNWMDLALNGNRAAYDALNSANHCDNCTPGDWMIKAKDLDKLLK